MASIVRDPNGRKRILYFNADGVRKPLRLGVATMGYAREVASNVDLLIAAKRNGAAPEPKAVDWLASIGDDLHKKLAEHGIVAPRAKAAGSMLATFLDNYIAKRADVKGGTAVVYGHTRRCLVEYFGADKPLAEITPADADDWRRWLGLAKNEKQPEKGGQGLSDNTVRRRCGIARQFFRDAVRRRLIAESPFAEMQGVVVRSNRSRDYFVTRKQADAVLKACPDAQWKLLFALSRYGGLRCPSEHLALTWGDVDWDAGRITVKSSKTEHHEGKGERVMPLFPELRPYLEAVRNELLAGDFDPKKTPISKQPVITRYRDANANLRTQLIKIIRRAGLKPWPKLFQNLRATRATELADEYPTHVAADWLGHSTTIADKHYRQTTADHFAKAVGIAPEGAAQNAAQLDAVAGIQGDVTENDIALLPR
jgi:integrase